MVDSGDDRGVHLRSELRRDHPLLDRTHQGRCTVRNRQRPVPITHHDPHAVTGGVQCVHQVAPGVPGRTQDQRRLRSTPAPYRVVYVLAQRRSPGEGEHSSIDRPDGDPGHAEDHVPRRDESQRPSPGTLR